MANHIENPCKLLLQLSDYNNFARETTFDAIIHTLSGRTHNYRKVKVYANLLYSLLGPKEIDCSKACITPEQFKASPFQDFIYYCKSKNKQNINFIISNNYPKNENPVCELFIKSSDHIKLKEIMKESKYYDAKIVGQTTIIKVIPDNIQFIVNENGTKNTFNPGHICELKDTEFERLSKIKNNTRNRSSTASTNASTNASTASINN